LLAPRPTPKLEDHPSSAVRDCLFNLFAATLHIGIPSQMEWGSVPRPDCFTPGKEPVPIVQEALGMKLEPRNLAVQPVASRYAG